SIVSILMAADARTVVPMRSTVAPTAIAGGLALIVTSWGAFLDGGVLAMNQRSASSGMAMRSPIAWRAMLSIVVGCENAKRLAERSAARRGRAIPTKRTTGAAGKDRRSWVKR